MYLYHPNLYQDTEHCHCPVSFLMHLPTSVSTDPLGANHCPDLSPPNTCFSKLMTSFKGNHATCSLLHEGSSGYLHSA